MTRPVTELGRVLLLQHAPSLAIAFANTLPDKSLIDLFFLDRRHEKENKNLSL